VLSNPPEKNLVFICIEIVHEVTVEVSLMSLLVSVVF
jgi:hypothetical protein